MPPDWLPLVALLLIIGVSALRVMAVKRARGVDAFGFGRHAAIQSLAERGWKIAVVGALAVAAIAWLAPRWEAALGKPPWADAVALRWLAAAIFALSAPIIFIAQRQMGASWRVGVPADGPSALVSHGLFGWSRNPIFVGLLGAVLALFVWSPHIATGAILAATWTLTQVQVRIEEETLRETHGNAYERYAARVGRWLGRTRPCERPGCA